VALAMMPLVPLVPLQRSYRQRFQIQTSPDSKV
jgi:hypothetical protein